MGKVRSSPGIHERYAKTQSNCRFVRPITRRLYSREHPRQKPDDCGRCCALATSTNERGLDGHPYILLGLLRMTDYTVHACPGPDHYLSMHHFFQQMPETRRPRPCCHTATRAVCRASRNSGAQTRMATRAPDWGSVARGTLAGARPLCAAIGPAWFP